jgi:hypothetical protein
MWAGNGNCRQYVCHSYQRLSIYKQCTRDADPAILQSGSVRRGPEENYESYGVEGFPDTELDNDVEI